MKYKCNVCGYIHTGEEAPEKCPKCGALKEHFKKLSDEAVELIEKSKYTNFLHMKIKTMLKEVNDYAKIGIDENLDPGCVATFSRLIKYNKEAIQSIKAELEAHMKKGKWG